MKNCVNNSRTLAVMIAAMFLIVGCKSKQTQEVPTGKVVKGTLYFDLYEEGEVEAVNSTNIVAPMVSWRYTLKITHIVKDGQEVNAGDTVLIFDPSDVHKAITDAESRLVISMAELDKMKAQHQSDLEGLRADYEVTRLSLEISKIRFESAEYESDVAKKQIKLNLEKADIALERAHEQIQNRIRIQKEEIKQKNLAIDQDKLRLKEAFETLEKFNVTSPAPGIAIIARNWSTNNKFQMGEQCWAGFPLIQLPDLSELKATVKINEVDIAKISKGLSVEIKPDAFSDKTFTGIVTSVANLAVNKEGSTKIKIFPVEIKINETDKNLLPGLTVSFRIIVDKIDDVLYVPLDAIIEEGEDSYVYKKSGAKSYDKVKVETGGSNSDYIIITQGLEENDVITLCDPTIESKSEDGKEADKGKTEQKL